MKRKDGGFSLVEVLVSIVVLALVVVPLCTSLVMSVRMNAKADALLQAQLAVSSTVETLMAEGITRASDTYDIVSSGEGTEDMFPDTMVKTSAGDNASYYNVEVTSNDGLVTVITSIHAAPPTVIDPGNGEGDGQ